MSTTKETPIANENANNGGSDIITAGASTYNNVIKTILAEGGKRINGVRIKNVNATEKDNYTMISFTLTSPIRGYISKDNGVTYELGETHTIYTSLFAILGAMKEDEELGWMANSLLERPAALNLIFNGASIDILQQEIAAGEAYVNPFSTNEDAQGLVYDHDIIINNIVKFKLGKTGQKMADKFADKLLGF